MADQYNLVDNMISEMNQNNSPQVLGYNPNPPMQGGGGGQMGAPTGAPPQQMQQMQQPMMGQQPMPPQYAPQEQGARMGEVQYNPPSQQQAPTVQNNMHANMQGEQMVPEDEDQHMMMDAPDLSSYGMDEEEGGMMDGLLEQSKGPLIVVALAFLMSLPQVSGMVRNLVARFTTNPMYVNVMMAVLMGVAFYLVNMVLG